MNKFELESILKKARIPQPPEEFWEEFPEQVARQLNRPEKPEQPARRNRFPRFAWAVGMAICIIAAFLIGHWRGQMEATKQPQDVLANAKMVRETLAMFPNQLRAITEDRTGLHVLLSDSGGVPSSPPLYIHICDGKNCSSLVTFSGQQIQVAGQKMTVLANAHGGIILMGENFVWASDQRITSTHGLEIEAKNLGVAAL